MMARSKLVGPTPVAGGTTTKTIFIADFTLYQEIIRKVALEKLLAWLFTTGMAAAQPLHMFETISSKIC